MVLDLPEDLVQVQLLVGEGGHLVAALGPPVPVDQQPYKAIFLQAAQEIQHLLQAPTTRCSLIGRPVTPQ